MKVKYVKSLGVLVDELLTWKYHINELSKKLSRTTGIFLKLRQYVPLQTLICLYDFLTPLFTYLKLVNLLEMIYFSPLKGPQVIDNEQFNILAPNYGMLCHFPYVLKDLFQYFDLN